MGNLKNWTNTNPQSSSTESPEKNEVNNSEIIQDISITECNSSPTGIPKSKDESLKEVEKENCTPNVSYSTVMCKRSAMIVTCYSPALENGENYANVISTLRSPQSVYSTPNKEDEMGEFSTPSHVHSMHLMDLTTTPKTKAPDTPTSSGKYVAVQGFSSSPILVSDTSTDSLSAPSSSEVPEPKSPEQKQMKTNLQNTVTPKRTPQSLMKRAILTSAKKAGHTPASRRSLMGISEKSLSIVRRAPQITPRTNKLTADRLDLSLRNMELAKSPNISSARKSLSALKYTTPEKKKSPPRKSMSATKATPEAIKALTRKSMSAKASLTSRKSMFAGPVKTPKPSIASLRKSMVALSQGKSPASTASKPSDMKTTSKPNPSSKTPTLKGKTPGQMNVTCDMEGLSDLMKTPKTKKTLNRTCDMEGLGELMKTPTGKITPQKSSFNDTCDMEGISELMKTPTTEGSTPATKNPSMNETCNMEGISDLMKTPVAMERSRTFIVDTPADKVFNTSSGRNLMMVMSPNRSINVGSDVCADTLEEINTTVDVNSTIEITGIEDDILKDNVIVQVSLFNFQSYDF